MWVLANFSNMVNTEPAMYAPIITYSNPTWFLPIFYSCLYLCFFFNLYVACKIKWTISNRATWYTSHYRGWLYLMAERASTLISHFFLGLVCLGERNDERWLKGQRDAGKTAESRWASDIKCQTYGEILTTKIQFFIG